jgi:hypothetical protein
LYYHVFVNTQKHLYQAHSISIPTLPLQQQQQHQRQQHQQQQHSFACTTTAAASNSGSHNKRRTDNTNSNDNSSSTEQQKAVEVDTVSGLRLNDTSWSALTSTYEELFCRKCLKYACVKHDRYRDATHLPRDPAKNVTVPSNSVSNRDQLRQLLVAKRSVQHTHYCHCHDCLALLYAEALVLCDVPATSQEEQVLQ